MCFVGASVSYVCACWGQGTQAFVSTGVYHFGSEPNLKLKLWREGSKAREDGLPSKDECSFLLFRLFYSTPCVFGDNGKSERVKRGKLFLSGM